MYEKCDPNFQPSQETNSTDVTKTKFVTLDNAIHQNGNDQSKVLPDEKGLL